jgi:hypothetical protein
MQNSRLLVNLEYQCDGLLSDICQLSTCLSLEQFASIMLVPHIFRLDD